jgi:hypothetical protein
MTRRAFDTAPPAQAGRRGVLFGALAAPLLQELVRVSGARIE